MLIEYEATYINLNKTAVRKKLKQVGATLIKPEFMQKRTVFDLPAGHEIDGGWLRVRDEKDKITMSLKVVAQTKKITDQKEICLTVDNYNNAVKILEAIGCPFQAYQETKREIWQLDGVEVDIDEWPFLEPMVEIEGSSEKVVKAVSKKLGFDYSTAKFCSADFLYQEKYGLSLDKINSTPKITFNIKNPFLKGKNNLNKNDTKK